MLGDLDVKVDTYPIIFNGENKDSYKEIGGTKIKFYFRKTKIKNNVLHASSPALKKHCSQIRNKIFLSDIHKNTVKQESADWLLGVT